MTFNDWINLTKFTLVLSFASQLVFQFLCIDCLFCQGSHQILENKFLTFPWLFLDQNLIFPNHEFQSTNSMNFWWKNRNGKLLQLALEKELFTWKFWQFNAILQKVLDFSLTKFLFPDFPDRWEPCLCTENLLEEFSCLNFPII